MPGLVCLPEYKPKGGSQGLEFRRRHEGEINLQSAREEKYTVHPSTGLDVEMMQYKMPIVHIRGPITEEIRQVGGIADAKGEIYVGPGILTRGGCGSSYGGAADARIAGGVFEEIRAQASTFIRSKHGCSDLDTFHA